MSVIFYGCISMDGYLADKNHNLDWLYESGSAEETDYDIFYKSIDITIMGKRTFEAIENIENISSLYATSTNYVFTHDESLAVRGFIPVKGDVVEFVQGLDKDKNIWIVGGNTVLAPLLNQQLVDKLIIQVAPVLLGEGIPLFTQEVGLKRFYLEEVKQFGPFAELRYHKIDE